MRIAVVGSGGVGGYFGGRMAAAGNEVTFVARGPHLAAIRDRGLRVQSVKGDFTVIAAAHEDPTDVGPCDVVLFCVKSYDTDSLAARLGPLLGAQTAVVTLQNGVDNVPKLAAAVGAEHVVGGAAFILSFIIEPGLIGHTGGPARILFGELNGERSQRVERLLEACQQAGIDADVPPDIRVTLWTKFAFICALAGMTASVRLPLGDIQNSAESWPMFRQIVDEVVALAWAEGVPLGDDVTEQQIAFAEGLAPDSYSSLHHDLTSGRRMELEALHGVVVRWSRRHALPAPASEAVYRILHPWALRNEK
jgi:2-dehydropantoate 2-reductase